jgi:hypothetical protein
MGQELSQQPLLIDGNFIYNEEKKGHQCDTDDNTRQLHLQQERTSTRYNCVKNYSAHRIHHLHPRRKETR